MAKLTVSLKANSRELRKNQTEAERVLWNHLRARRFFNYRFRRQQVVGPYIVDFYCSEVGLIVELDGGQHAYEEAILYDQLRTDFLNSCDCTVIRFWNNDVINNIHEVLTSISSALSTPLPNPLPQGERERNSTRSELNRQNISTGLVKKNLRPIGRPGT